MTIRRIFIGALCTIVFVVGVVFALSPRSRDVMQADFNLLKPGMTQPEVEHLLHGPPRNNLKYPGIAWIPQPDGKLLSGEVGPWFRNPTVVFRGNRPLNDVAQKPREYAYFPGTTAEPGHQTVWITEAGLIAVYFGRDGRLQRKYFSTVAVARPPTALDWFASRPRAVRKSLGRR
jgi:hypothetical protein